MLIVILLSNFHHIKALNPAAEIWISYKAGKTTKMISLNTIATNLGTTTCSAMTLYHTFTGSESTFSFKFKGTTTRDVERISPTKDALDQHLKRSVFQVSIWATTHISMMLVNNPNNHGGEYSCLLVALIFKREFSYYLIQYYIPCCMLVIVSWVSFWLDQNAVPARVALGVTTLLTMSTQTSSINQSLPPVSYTKVGHTQPHSNFNNCYTGEYSCLRVDLVFKREFSYYLIQYYIPCCMLVIVSWVSFWLDQNAVPARVSLGVTTLLTMSTQTSSINNTLPPVSYTKVNPDTLDVQCPHASPPPPACVPPPTHPLTPPPSVASCPYTHLTIRSLACCVTTCACVPKRCFPALYQCGHSLSQLHTHSVAISLRWNKGFSSPLPSCCYLSLFICGPLLFPNYTPSRTASQHVPLNNPLQEPLRKSLSHNLLARLTPTLQQYLEFLKRLDHFRPLSCFILKGKLSCIAWAIDVWTGVCLTFVFGALLEFALVNYASRSDKHREKMKEKLKEHKQWEMAQAAALEAALSDQAEDGHTFPMPAPPPRPRRLMDYLMSKTKPLVSRHNGGMGGDKGHPCEIHLAAPRKNCCRTWLSKFPTRSKRIDVISRITFPIVFAFFNMAYWSTYLFTEEEEEGKK
ncbi:hypothetical protein Pcinc_005293 [Petrolisthes cinctipes]|uniref:Neurotransmitter-gated ion-channel transmembrane domain-containing protein n=1 Tax=Petrolisthes cinctipes TaxID=88211 RepID=A0AAE1GJQ3_PETCI|nr:hypothetical protein Pcinc_005293 [Petrolisthes cinctipes]